MRRANDEADLNRAVQAYRFFYPSVSIMATWKANLLVGHLANKVFGLLEGTPKQYVFTPNSDTPYSGLPLDVSEGPMVLEFPPGPLNTHGQRPEPAVGPGHGPARPRQRPVAAPMSSSCPFMMARTRSLKGLQCRPARLTNRLMVLLRALPRGKDMTSAIQLMKSVKVGRLGPGPGGAGMGRPDPEG